MTRAINRFLLLAAMFLLTGITGAQTFSATTTVVDAPTIAGRAVQLDAHGKLLPWPIADNTGYSYSSYFLTQWTIVLDQYNRQRLPYYFCCFDFDRTTFEMIPDQHWANSTGYLRAMMQGFMERLYPYTGDPRTLEFVQDLVNYELENGLTPTGYAWSEVPYASANPGAHRYTGWSEHAEDFVEPHVVGEDGYGYVRLYEMTGNTKYLQAAIRCADALVKNYKVGDEEHSPWPYRSYARDNSIAGGKGLSAYSANVVEPIMLFDELIRLDQGDVAAFKRVREGSWLWLMQYPMRNNKWLGYFEDVQASGGNLNQVIPLELARYLILHPDKDPEWRKHSSQLIHWVKTTPMWPKYVVHGATVTTEQGNGKEFCCNVPPQCCDSHSSRLAATEALYYAKTGDVAYKEEAYRTYNFVTYFQGLSKDAHAPFADQWWFTDEFADGPRRLMDAFWAVPEWAPSDESHLLGSLSAVTKVAYGAGSVTYSTFDADSTDVLRLNFAPESIMVGGKRIAPRNDLEAEGYLFNSSSRTLYIRHTHAKDVDVQGKDGQTPPSLITFDDPHLAAGTPLTGQYPTGVIDWTGEDWKIDTPYGKFGTFTLALRNPATTHAAFRFYSPRVFQGVDVYNGGDEDATITLSSPEVREIVFTVKPKELRRLRTQWRDASSRVNFDMTNAQSLRFDNLAYSRP